jgi:LysR family transcriptional activator of glutamate synthase operon
LVYFVKVARKQHVTHAAEEMHVAQSAVSRQIHQLEAELGVQLFVQKGRKLHLTPVGKLFLTRIEEVLNTLEWAVQEVRESQDPETGEIRLAFPHSLGVHLVPAAAGAFRKTHPKVRFRLKQGKYNSLINMVMDGEVDLALISPFPAGHEHVEGEVVLTEELYAIVPPNHPLSGCESLRLEQLKDETFVMFSDGYSLHTIVREACMASGFVPKMSFEGEETDTIRGLVAAGMGVSLLPEMALRYSGSPLMPVKIRISEPKVTRTIGLIRRRDERLPLVAERFRTFLIEHIGKI